MINIAINGFGRIGRNFLRAFLQDIEAQKHIKVRAINIGPARKDMVAHMFQYDTIMGTYHGTVQVSDTTLIIDDQQIELIAHSDPKDVDWASRSIEWVVECSGRFTTKTHASLHLNSGAQRVLISAPSRDADITIIPGINESLYDPAQHHIVSLGSCTTNAFVPIVHVLHTRIGLISGTMTTIHAYTNSQVLLDVEAKDERRSRAAALNIIPTSTGASALIATLMPELAGHIQAMALRIPVAKVSLIDFSFIVHHPVDAQQINTFFSQASITDPLRGIVSITDKPLVSSDFSGDPHSVIIDGLSTRITGTLGKVLGWYDNEWAYSNRLKDFLVRIL